MRVLHLPLKKEWYEMIERGEKTEEYREISTHWFARLTKCGKMNCRMSDCPDDCEIRRYEHFDAVRFSYGYTKRTMVFEIKEIVVGKGDKEYGAPDEEVFIIKLGQRLTEVKLTIESPNGEKVTNTFFGESIT